MSEQNEPDAVQRSESLGVPPGTPYVNAARLLLSHEEAFLSFGLRRMDPTDMDQVLAVAMSLPHLKRLALLLVGQVNAFEARFGRIPTQPPGDAEPEDEQHGNG